MEYPQQYQQGVRHPPGHLPQYNAPTQAGAPNGNITSPRQPSQPSHTSSQQSPVVPSQNQSYNPQTSQQPSNYSMHQPMAYPPQAQPYGLPSHLQNSQYPMSTSDAAAMATAAASGSGYYQMPNAGYRPGPGGPVKNEGRQHPGSPRQQMPMGSIPSHLGPAQPISGRHVNHGSPPMQPPMGQGQPRGSVPPQMAQQPGQQQPSPEAAPAGEEAPLYVNAKQFHRILKRRVARQKLEEQLRLTRGGRKPYLHESRHNHAMRRPRGPGGRFLTADEVAALDKKAAEGGGDDVNIEDKIENGEMPSRSGSAQPAGAKRKAEDGEETNGAAKKSRLSENGEEDEDEEDGEDES